jgi:hypothetical protein
MIESNCDLVQYSHNQVTVKLPSGAEDAWATLVQRLAEKRVNQVYVKIGYPRKPRTTGDKSQNHALNGIIQQIIQETGDEFDDVKEEIKKRAIKRGYSFHTDTFGNVHGDSEANASTVECSMLIDEAKDLAAFCNVKLRGFYE